MNGPEHYRAAEQLLNAVDGREELTSVESVNAVIAAAQVHATLALAAASAPGVSRWSDETGEAWRAVIE